MTNIINSLFLIVGLGYFVPFIQAIPYGNVNYQTQKDCQTLLDIYQHFHLNTPFKTDSNCCDYYVRLAASNDNYPTTEWICDSSNTINAIMIKDRNISTDIPWNLLEKLENLEVLHLYNNQLTGEIKPDLRKFSNLKQLRVQNNNLNGYLPTYLPPKIETLIFNGNEINDSVPDEWKSVTTIRDCIIPNTICNPRNSQMACFTDSTKNDKTSVCKNDAQEDRSAAHQILNDGINNDNNGFMDNYNNNIDNDNDLDNNNNNLMNNNNMDYDDNNIDNNYQNNNNGLNNGVHVSKKGKRSYAVLIMTLSIISLLLIILLIVTIVSHYSRKKTREKEKDIYKGTTLYESSDQTEASIFYSKNSNNMYAYDENNNNSISLFNYTNPHETENNINNVNDNNNNQLLVGGSQSDELSFIENAPQNPLEEVSFSVIDPSAEFIEPQPAAIKPSYKPIM